MGKLLGKELDPSVGKTGKDGVFTDVGFVWFFGVGGMGWNAVGVAVALGSGVTIKNEIGAGVAVSDSSTSNGRLHARVEISKEMRTMNLFSIQDQSILLEWR